jgi:YegS/Rv2252/BmrU family lipid kinase
MTQAPAPPRRVLVVVNPISGRGRAARAAEELVRGFEQRGVATETLLTTARGEVPRLLAAAGPADLVVAVGGDGTLSEVLLGLDEPTTPVGLLPSGTANVLARALALPMRPAQALEVLLRMHTQGLDVARVGSRCAHLVVGVGFDARVVTEVERRRRGPITKATYVAATLRALARHRCIPLRVWIDGREVAGPIGMVWLANTPMYAGVVRLTRDARVDDGRWEAYLFPMARAPGLLAAMLRGVLAGYPSGGVALQHARSLRVEAAEPVPYQVDGDLAGETPLEVNLLPQRFRMVVP